MLHDENTHAKGVQVTFQISKPEVRQSILGLHSHDALLALLTKIHQPMKTSPFVIQAADDIVKGRHHSPSLLRSERGYPPVFLLF
ncbi:MAG: hypothetical protein M1318_02090, partial [Firmicutes bacterium]|nr:hypothetical protein [Bacillota bacterium]